jgi:hypothetical protein
MRPVAIALLLTLLALPLTCIGAQQTKDMDALRVVRASDLVRPDETVLLVGGNFGPGVSLLVGRLSDRAATAPGRLTAPAISGWTAIRPSQVGLHSVKFVVPAAWRMGVFACRVASGGKTSAPVLVRAGSRRGSVSSSTTASWRQ